MYKEKIISSTNVLLYKHHDDLSYAKTEEVSMIVVKENHKKNQPLDMVEWFCE
jgi:hypothetical protein